METEREKIREQIWVMQKAHDIGKAALTDAGANAAVEAAAEHLGETTAPNIAALRREAQNAEEKLAQAMLVRDGLALRVPGAREAVEWSTRKRDEAARDVVRNSPELRQLIERCETAKREAATLSAVLLEMGPLIWPVRYRPDTIAAPDLGSPLFAEWRSAIQHLASDAEAPLPGGDAESEAGE